jgi:hypothetical protein
VPECGLADAGFPEEDERCWARPEGLEEVVQRLELFLTADDVDVGRGYSLPAPC